MNETRSSIRYSPRPDATPEGERVALAAVYRYVTDCAAKKKAGVDGAGAGTKGPENDRPANTILLR